MADNGADGVDKPPRSIRRPLLLLLFAVSGLLLIGSGLVPLVARERTCDKNYTTTTTETLDDSTGDGKVNLTIRAPRYIHPTDTAEIRLTLERDNSFEGYSGDSDELLVDGFVSEHHVSEIDAELIAPGFSVLRLTPDSRSSKVLRVGFAFVLTPKSEGRQLYVYRIRMRNARRDDVSYTAYSGSIDVEASPFALGHVSTILGLAGTAIGLYLQFKKKDFQA